MFKHTGDAQQRIADENWDDVGGLRERRVLPSMSLKRKVGVAFGSTAPLEPTPLFPVPLF